MNIQQIEQDLVLCRHLLQTIATTRQLCRDAYMASYLSEMSDRTAVQISLLTEILYRADEFQPDRKVS